MKLHKSIPTGILRIPKDMRRELGDEIILQPNTKCAVIYGRNEKPERVIRSLKLIIMDMKQEIKGGDDNNGGTAEEKQPDKLEDATQNGK